jgi:hypothetical protein
MREMTWKVFCGFLIFENKTTIVILIIKPCTNIEEPKLDMKLPILLILIKFPQENVNMYGTNYHYFGIQIKGAWNRHEIVYNFSFE